MIYQHLAATEEHFVSGRRFVDAHKADKKLSLDECFDEAVALHPLSMTCHQMPDEFQPIHHFSLSALDARWVLVVNNFNFQQLALLYAYLDSGEFFEWRSYAGKDESPTWPASIVRFQMDNEAVRSMITLCEHLRNHFASRKLHEYEITEMCLLRVRHVEVLTRYHNRTTTPADHHRNMLPGEAECVKHFFEKTCDEIEKLPIDCDYVSNDIRRYWMRAVSKAMKKMPGRRRFAEFNDYIILIEDDNVDESEPVSEFEDS